MQLNSALLIDAGDAPFSILRSAALQGPAKLIHPSLTEEGNGSYVSVCAASSSNSLPQGN